MFSAARNSPHTAGLSHWRICIFCFIEFWELWLLWLHLRCDWESVPRVKVRFHRACGIFPALGWSKEWARNTIYKPGITLLIFIWRVDLWKHWVENVQSGFHRQIQPSSYCTCHVIHESTDRVMSRGAHSCHRNPLGWPKTWPQDYIIIRGYQEILRYVKIWHHCVFHSDSFPTIK